MKESPYEDMMMDEIMRRWPSTVHVVLRHHMLCVGCLVASFHTVDDAVREHNLDGARFRADLRIAIDGGG